MPSPCNTFIQCLGGREIDAFVSLLWQLCTTTSLLYTWLDISVTHFLLEERLHTFVVKNSDLGTSQPVSYQLCNLR
jgi:hypothetical protein